MLIKNISQSMVARITFSMFAVILMAEIAAGVVWYTTTSQAKKESASHAISVITSAAANTINYISQLPPNYRHLVLEQLRNVGGTRFFISMNNHPVSMASLHGYSLVPGMESLGRKQLSSELKATYRSSILLTQRDELKLFNSGIKLTELPALWKDYSLVLGKLDLPIVVIQVELSENEWLYLATVLPLSFDSLTTKVIDARQIIFLFIATVLLVGVSYVVLQKEIRPFRSLAKSATLMGSRLHADEIKEEGSSETRAAVHAFNKMNRRIRAYLRDREMFFSAISHDIKTPLACLKLRTDMLDDDETRGRFEKLLNELETMLNGALQCMKDNDIHEELEWIDVLDLLQQSADVHNVERNKVTLHCPEEVKLFGKPLAIKRCLFNLAENAVKYGDTVRIDVSCSEGGVHIVYRDSGPGLAEEMLEKVFEPYFRVNKDKDGSGLGLSISRNIARSHGGDITLSNASSGGLEVDLVLENVL